jgi:hypothetical protein
VLDGTGNRSHIHDFVRVHEVFSCGRFFHFVGSLQLEYRMGTVGRN